MLTNPFHFLSLFGHRSATGKGRVRWVSLLVWGPANLIRFGVSLVAGSEKDSFRSLSLSPPLSLSLSLACFPSFGGWQAVRTCVCASLVWFGDFGFYFDHWSLWHIGPPVKRLFLATSMMGGWELGDGEAVCFRLFGLFLPVCWFVKFMLSHGVCVAAIERSCNV